jgi:hypothetical protein
MTAAAQALKFVMADFKGNWDIAVGPDNIIYQAKVNNAGLEVVREDPKGRATTYYYALSINDNVIIFDDVIHVPQRCIGRKAGNRIKC